MDPFDYQLWPLVETMLFGRGLGLQVLRSHVGVAPFTVRLGQLLITLPETIIEVEYRLVVEENSLARGHVPLPCLLDGGCSFDRCEGWQFCGYFAGAPVGRP